jgi:hypothetical protein
MKKSMIFLPILLCLSTANSFAMDQSEQPEQSKKEEVGNLIDLSQDSTPATSTTQVKSSIAPNVDDLLTATQLEHKAIQTESSNSVSPCTPKHSIVATLYKKMAVYVTMPLFLTVLAYILYTEYGAHAAFPDTYLDTLSWRLNQWFDKCL